MLDVFDSFEKLFDEKFVLLDEISLTGRWIDEKSFGCET